MTSVLCDEENLKALIAGKDHALRQAAVELKEAALLLKPDYPQMSGIFEIAAKAAHAAAE